MNITNLIWTCRFFVLPLRRMNRSYHTRNVREVRVEIKFHTLPIPEMTLQSLWASEWQREQCNFTTYFVNNDWNWKNSVSDGLSLSLKQDAVIVSSVAALTIIIHSPPSLASKHTQRPDFPHTLSDTCACLRVRECVVLKSVPGCMVLGPWLTCPAEGLGGRLKFIKCRRGKDQGASSWFSVCGEGGCHRGRDTHTYSCVIIY